MEPVEPAEAAEAAEAAEVVEVVEAEEAPSAFAFTQSPAAGAELAVSDEPPGEAESATEPEQTVEPEPEAAAEAAAEAAMEPAEPATEAPAADAGASPLAALRKQLEEAEDKMQSAVDNDDFEAASELQELVDELTDEIERLQAA